VSPWAVELYAFVLSTRYNDFDTPVLPTCAASLARTKASEELQCDGCTGLQSVFLRNLFVLNVRIFKRVKNCNHFVRTSSVQIRGRRFGNHGSRYRVRLVKSAQIPRQGEDAASNFSASLDHG
jgi:hypothetical protein